MTAASRLRSTRPIERRPVVQVVFLLGAGISVDAGMPDVGCITRQVLTGQGVWRHTDGTYVLNGDSAVYEMYRPPVVPVLELVCETVAQVGNISGAQPNYEELAYVLQQMHDALSGNYENPAVMPFADQLAGALRVDRRELSRRCEEAGHYISDTVAALLRRGNLSEHRHLAAILEACRELDAPVTLATLNHDLLLESALDDNRIAFSDGFERTGDDVRFWKGDWSGSVEILKLHGAIDWYDVRGPHSGDWRLARYIGRDVDHLELGRTARSSRPTFLTGTFSKILAYQTGNFPALHAHFQQRLRAADRVVAAGYGFGDKAINNHLITWLAGNLARRMVVCHERADEAKRDSRLAIRDRWDNWQHAGRLVTVPKFIADLSFADLARELSP